MSASTSVMTPGIRVIFRRRMLAISFAPDRARAEGLRVHAWDFLFYARFGLVVTSFVQLGGVLLVFSFLIVPAVCANLLAETFAARLLIGWLGSTLASVAGLDASFQFDLPTGAAIVCSLGGLLVVVILGVRARLLQRAELPPLLPFAVGALVISLGAVNPVALITGASRGIGRGIALALARLGHDLVINYARNAEAARTTAADCIALASTQTRTISALPCGGDIADAAARQVLLDFTRARFGRLDLLVNNAGVAPEVRADLLDTSEASFDRLLEVNVKGPFFLTQLAARWLIDQVRTDRAAASAATAPPRPPQIVFISSISAYTASVNRGEYCVAKAALAMLTPLFATRLAEHGIHVYEIRPGIIETDMTSPVKAKYDALIADGLTPIRRWGTPDDVGRAVAAIAQGAFPFTTGEVFNVDGGFHLRRL